MKAGKIGAAVVLLLAVALVAYAEYDRAAMQKVMQNNLANLPKLNAAANAGNYMEAAGHLLSIAQGMYSVKSFTPLKGEPAAFDQLVTTFLKTTFKALAACADEDQAALKAAVAELTKLRDEGHAAFRTPK